MHLQLDEETQRLIIEKHPQYRTLAELSGITTTGEQQHDDVVAQQTVCMLLQVDYMVISPGTEPPAKLLKLRK